MESTSFLCMVNCCIWFSRFIQYTLWGYADYVCNIYPMRVFVKRKYRKLDPGKGKLVVDQRDTGKKLTWGRESLWWANKAERKRMV